MSIPSRCGPACWTPVECVVCRKTKAPRGRSVALEATAGYCHDDCPGYEQAPKPPHYWPNERPEPEAAPSPGGPRA